MAQQMDSQQQLVYGHFNVQGAKAQGAYGQEYAAFLGNNSQQLQPQGEQPQPQQQQSTPQMTGQNPPPQQETIFNQGFPMNHAAGWQQVPMIQSQNGTAMMLPIQHGAQGMAVAGYAPAPQQFTSPSGSPSTSPAGTVPSSQANSPMAKKNSRGKKKGKKSRPSVFVGGIRTDITERELRNFFGVFGKINHVTIKEGYAFLDFADDASAHTAVEKCNGYVYDGKPLGVRIQDEGNRRTAQEAKKQGQNVSMVFKRMEEGQPMPAPMQQAPMQMHQQQQQQQQGMQAQQAMAGRMQLPPQVAQVAAVMSP
eukprot:TRINITY_DN576_c0_g1_i1.p2 TRINITY_DN576_c0_g1~~TRINITY_DN576_c0_g1_i1.p2  ORF type:complete len:309 (+),score=181.72 TRINITY_DN576_c0_g1_i1:68-994(+)